MKKQEDLSKIIVKKIQDFIFLKRKKNLIYKTLELCSKKTIKNDLIYHQIILTSLNGFTVELINFTNSLYETINICKQNLEQFSRKNPEKLLNNNQPIPPLKNLPVEPNQIIFGLDRRPMVKSSFLEKYSLLFPDLEREKERRKNEWRPSCEDFEKIVQHAKTMMEPIKSHRDTCAAHLDKVPKPATTKQLTDAMDYLEELLSDLYFILTCNVHSFDLGGYAANIEETAISLSKLICKDEVILTESQMNKPLFNEAMQ